MNILEIGGGHNPFPFDKKKHSIVRIDWNPIDSDIVHDLNIFPYPFEDNAFDLIYSSHCIEHLSDKLKVFQEIHRLLKKNAIAIIRVPHITSTDAWNFDHLHVWKLGSMNCFTNAGWYGGGTFPQYDLLFERLHWRSPSPIRLFKNSAEEYADKDIVKKEKKKYKTRHKIINFIINRNKLFAEKFLYYWLFGIKEIEYIIKAKKD
jgi:SAM-dependent methyltransferase